MSYERAWRRELGRHIAPKRHLIDALVLGTRSVVQDVDKARTWAAGIVRWRKDALVARTIGFPEPSINDYLPDVEIANG